MSDIALPENLPSLPPTQADLPYDDGVPMETQRHKYQMDLLIDALSLWMDDRPDGFVSGNMFVYYSLEQVRNQDFKGPDFFAVLGVPKTERLSWVVWEEGKAPDVVIELLSRSTALYDKTDKKLIYQDRMRVPEYFWFDPFNPDDWAGFSLQQGVYQPIAPNAQNLLVSHALQLALTRWYGAYRGVENVVWLRWATLDGTLLPTQAEKTEAERIRAEGERIRAEEERIRAEGERQRAEEERQRAEEERQRAQEERQRAQEERQRAEQAEAQVKQIVLNLLNQGMAIEQVAAMTGLTVEQLNEFRSNS